MFAPASPAVADLPGHADDGGGRLAGAGAGPRLGMGADLDEGGGKFE